MAARNVRKRMKKLDLGKEETWSFTHSYYANMGGFVARNPLADKTIYHDPYHLTGEDILELRAQEHITRLPDMSEAEIKDKSKSDMLGKLIATGQITWSTIQIIARAVRKLPVSPLEAAVVAFAVCAIFIYVLYWEKPQRVDVTRTIQLNTNNQLYNKAMLDDNPRFTKEVFHTVLKLFGFSVKKPLLRGAPISLDGGMAQPQFSNMEGMIVLTAVPASAALFGGIHAIAWNFPFPSNIELVLWRCATIYTATAPYVSMLVLIIARLLLRNKPNYSGWAMFLDYFLLTLVVFLIALYPIARLFIIVEMFRTLYFLPPGSFISTWAASVPHIA